MIWQLLPRSPGPLQRRRPKPLQRRRPEPLQPRLRRLQEVNLPPVPSRRRPRQLLRSLTTQTPKMKLSVRKAGKVSILLNIFAIAVYSIFLFTFPRYWLHFAHVFVHKYGLKIPWRWHGKSVWWNLGLAQSMCCVCLRFYWKRWCCVLIKL